MNKLAHLSITQAGLITTLSQVISLVVGFGVINNTEAGILVAATTAAVNFAFLIANAVHAWVAQAARSHAAPSLVNPVQPAPTPLAPVPPVPPAA